MPADIIRLTSDAPQAGAAPAASLDRPRQLPEGGRAAPLVTAVEPLLLTADQAAALYAVSPATWYRWASAGRVPAAVRIGATVRWRRAELESHIEAGAPGRKTWEARRAAGNATGRPRQAGR